MAVAASAGLAACSLSPLQNRIHPGDDAFLVVAGTGSDGYVDLFALLPGGGEVYQLTFTAMTESAPRLTRLGDVVAFLRRGTGSGREGGALVVMNLLNGAERTLDIPQAAGALQAVGWSDDERHLFLDTDQGRWMADAPPAPAAPRPVPAEWAAAADSALDIWVGWPRFARVTPCDSGLCITGPNAVPARLAAVGGAATRWGRDSVAWLLHGDVVVRPLGPGPARRLALDPARVTAVSAVTYAEP